MRLQRQTSQRVLGVGLILLSIVLALLVPATLELGDRSREVNIFNGRIEDMPAWATLGAGFFGVVAFFVLVVGVSHLAAKAGA